MEERFNNTLLQLNNNDLSAVQVETRDYLGNYTTLKFSDGVKTSTSATKEILTEKYGSPEKFFDDLFKKGVKVLKITDRYRNGSTAWKTVGTPYEFSMDSSADEPLHQKQIEVIKPQQVQQFTQPENVNYSHNKAGLSGADNFKIFNHETLKEENIVLKAKIEALQEKNKELYEQNLRNEIQGVKSVEKGENTNKLLATLVPMIKPAIEAFASKRIGVEQGLAGVNGSAVQKTCVDFVLQQDDNFLSDWYNVGNRMLTDPEFDDKISELFTIPNPQ